MLTNEQNDMIDMILEGRSVLEISKRLNKARSTIYAWLKVPAISDEINSRKETLVKSARDKIVSKIDSCIDNIIDLANNSNDNRVKFQANKYLIDQAIGVPGVNKEDDKNPLNNKGDDHNALKAEMEEIKKMRVIK